MTYPSSSPRPGPIVPHAREGHGRRFSGVERRQILAKTTEEGAGVSEIALRYGIARRVICRWKQEQMVASPMSVNIEIARVPVRPGGCAMTLPPPGVKVHLAFG